MTARAYRKPAPRDRAAEAGPAPDRAAGRGDRAGPGYSPLATKAADGIRAAGRFGEPELWQADWELRYTRDEWLDLAPTQGDHSRFAPAELAAVLDGMGAAVDAMGGSFAMTYTTVALLAVNC